MIKPIVISLALLALVAGGAMAEPPEDAVRHYQTGLKLKRSGKPKRAGEELSKAVRIHPKYMAAHYALGWVHRQLGSDQKAIEHFREVIRIAPHSPEAVESARAIQRIRLGPEVETGYAKERVAFSATRGGNTDIYTADTTGAGLVRVTSHPAVDDWPNWSPDGRRIAFVSERDGNREIYIANADGTALVRVTDNPAADDHPVWSPDGQLLAFESRRTGNTDVYLITLDGAALRRITTWAEDEWMGDWSPDGRRLAWLSSRDGLTKTYVSNADGTQPRRLVPNDVPEGRPRWAPAGRHIYFTWTFERNLQVCRVRADGSELVNVTRSPYDEELCDVSADGRRLLVNSDRQGEKELYIIEIDTGAARRLTYEHGTAQHAVFAPRPQ